MKETSPTAAQFFGGGPSNEERIAEYYAGKNKSFDHTCARRILKVCPSFANRKISNSAQLTEGEIVGEPVSLKMMDEWARLPIRLVANPLEARKIGNPSRSTWDLGFHELQASDLLNFREFRRTQFYRAWRDAKESSSIDTRPVAVLFRCRNTVYAIHNATSGGPSHVQIRTDDGTLLRIETLDSLVNPAAEGA